MFQFTHPGKGATGTDKRIPVELVVSIHAPWEGCDLLLLCQLFVRACFNSRTLGRVRHKFKGAPVADLKFQFTHPGKGATHYGVDVPRGRGVSIHAPWEGCDGYRSMTSSTWLLFQFTHPGRGATTQQGKDINYEAVSIHAPREGCDHLRERPLY